MEKRNQARAYRLHIEKCFEGITFQEEGHIYKDETGKRLTSTTSFIEQFKAPFKAELIAERVAKKKGTTASMVLKEWNKIKEEALALGTQVHKYAEGFPQMGIPSNERESAVYKFYVDHVESGHYSFIASEVLVYNSTLGIAGTIDLILLNNSTGSLCLCDWKTSKEIKNKAYSNLFPPFEAYPQNNFYTYGLQLNTYRNLLQLGCGLPVDELKIIHLPKDHMKPVVYDVEINKPDMWLAFSDELLKHV